MLSKWLGNPTPWHGHYYCALALPTVALSQFALLRYARSDATAGISICTVATFAFLVKLHVSFATIANAALLFMWGVRVAVRGIPAPREFIVPPSAVELAFNKTVWIFLLSAPTVFAVSMDKHELANGWSVVVGVCICLSALTIDCFEVSTSDGRYSRNPYAYSSISIAAGLWIIHPALITLCFPNAFACLVLFAPGGTAWVEARRRARVVRDADAREYTRKTSPIFPMPPGCYERIPRFVKRTFLFEF